MTSAPNPTTTFDYSGLETFPEKRVRMVRPGYLGVLISAQGPEYVMPAFEANDLINLIYRAKHDGATNNG